MKRPTWAIIIGIIMLLFGGCGAFNRAGDIMLPKIMDIVDESISNIQDVEKSSSQNDLELESGDSTNNNTKKIEDLSEEERRALEIITDTIIVDQDNNMNFEATIKQAVHISDYRKKWIVRFGYIGLVIAVMFIIGGIMLLGFKKYTIPIVLTAITFSLTSNLLQIILYAADKETGTFVSSFSNITYYISLSLDILLLILIMVFDKTYFGPPSIQEDYYD